MTKKIKGKYLAIAGIAIAAVLVGSIFLVKAGGENAKYNIENWTGNVVESAEGPLGGITYNEGRTTFDQLATSVLQENVVTVSSASFAELATTSIELIPAPPTGFVNQVVSVIGYRKFASESWSTYGNRPTIGYSSGTNKVAITASLSSGLFSGPVGDTVASPSFIVVNPAIAHSAASNSPVVLRRSGATEPVIDGDTSFIFRVIYRVFSFE